MRQSQNRLSKQPCLPDIQKSDGSLVTEPQEKIEELKKVLMPTPHAADLSDLTNYIYPSDIPMLRITRKEILQSGNSLRANKAPGPDQIPNEVIKVIA